MNQNHKTILINEFNLTKKREKGRFKLKIFASRNMVFSLLYYPCDFVGMNIGLRIVHLKKLRPFFWMIMILLTTLD